MNIQLSELNTENGKILVNKFMEDMFEELVDSTMDIDDIVDYALTADFITVTDNDGNRVQGLTDTLNKGSRVKDSGLEYAHNTLSREIIDNLMSVIAIHNIRNTNGRSLDNLVKSMIYNLEGKTVEKVLTEADKITKYIDIYNA